MTPQDQSRAESLAKSAADLIAEQIVAAYPAILEAWQSLDAEDKQKVTMAIRLDVLHSVASPTLKSKLTVSRKHVQEAECSVGDPAQMRMELDGK